MSKKHRKKGGEIVSSSQRAAEVLNGSVHLRHPRSNGYVIELQEPTAVIEKVSSVSNGTVTENDVPIDLSKQTLNWQGDEDSPMIIADQIAEGDVGSIDSGRERRPFKGGGECQPVAKSSWA